MAAAGMGSVLSSMDRNDLVYMAKLAEQSERYDEMVMAMKSVAGMDMELSVEERNLLSVAYKNVIGARRASWRIISSIEQKEENKGNTHHVGLIKTYKSTVEDELTGICSEILDILEKHLIPSSQTGESKVFYYKMKGDYHRYLAEFKVTSSRQEAAENALVAYKSANDIAMVDLAPTHPIRLGLALNFSVFHYEVMNNHKQACELGEKALSDALEKIDDVDEETFRDAKSIIELLKENLSLWKEEEEQNQVDDL